MSTKRSEKTAKPKVLAFDVFGTVVDWHGTIVGEIEQLVPGINGDEFAMAWRAGYKPAMQRVMAGESGWTILDELHRTILEEVLGKFSITNLTEAQKIHLNQVWHRLKAWPDSVEGLTRLKAHYLLCTLSNGNLGLLAKLSKTAALPWDCILSAEVFGKYKPHPETYLGVARIFGVEPDEVMLVAAHHDDLMSARTCGLKTAYIERPLEFGKSSLKDVSRNPDDSLHAKNLIHLARLLSA